MAVVGQVRGRLGGVDSSEADPDILREVFSVYDGHRDGAVGIDIAAHVDVLGVTRGFNSGETRVREAEVVCKRPEASRDEMFVKLQSD